MVTLHINSRRGKSTTNEAVYKGDDNPRAKFIDEVVVPSLTMKQICERYVLKKINFLTIDV